MRILAGELFVYSSLNTGRMPLTHPVYIWSPQGSVLDNLGVLPRLAELN